MRQKALSILLAVFLVVAMLPLSASAADSDLFDQWVKDGIAQREGNNITLLNDFFIDAGMIAAVDADETLTVASGATLQVGGTLRVFGELRIQGTLYITAPKSPSIHPDAVNEDNLGLCILGGAKMIVEDDGYAEIHTLTTHYLSGDPLGTNMLPNTGLKGDIVIKSGGWLNYGRLNIGPEEGMWASRQPGVIFPEEYDDYMMHPELGMNSNAQVTVNFKNARTGTGIGYAAITVDRGTAVIDDPNYALEKILNLDIYDDFATGDYSGSIKTFLPAKLYVRSGASLEIFSNEIFANVPYENVEHLPALPENPSKYFDDVAADAWYCEAAEYVYEHGLMAGTDYRVFEPNTNLNRAQAVQILYNLEGQPVAAGSAGYSDTTDHWAINAINWATENGIASGVGNNRFNPNSPVSREQFAVMMYNYAQYKGDDLSAQADLTTFPDNGKVSSWALRALQWANGEGLINGSNGSLLPGGTATRGQAASILMKFDQNIVDQQFV